MELDYDEIILIVNAFIFHLEAIDDPDVSDKQKEVHAQAVIEINNSLPEEYKYSKLKHKLKEWVNK